MLPYLHKDDCCASKKKANHTSINDCQNMLYCTKHNSTSCSISDTVHIQRSLDSGFKERILTDDLLEEPVLDGGGSWALGGRGAGEGLDAGLPLSWDLGVREEREGGGLWRSCRTLGERRKGHGLIHRRKDADHPFRALHWGLLHMLVVVVVVLVLVEVSVFVLMVQDQLVVVLVGLLLLVSVLVVVVLPLALSVLMGLGVMGVNMLVIMRVGVCMALAVFVSVCVGFGVVVLMVVS